MTGNSSYYYYLAFLNYFKGGCLEIDPASITKDSDDILVYHYGFPHTNTGVYLSVLLKLIIIWVRANKDKLDLAPIILSIDNKNIKKYIDHQVIWKVLNTTLYHPINNDLVVPFHQKISVNEPVQKYCGKIILRWDQCHSVPPKICDNKGIHNPCNLNKDAQNSFHKSGGESIIRRVIALPRRKRSFQEDMLDTCVKSDWVTISRPAFKNNLFLEVELPRPRELTMSTIVQGNGLIKDNHLYPKLIENTENYLVRVYPCPLRHSNSSNYSAFKYLWHGIQFIALNFQHFDYYLALYLAFFQTTNRHAVALKPKNRYLMVTNALQKVQISLTGLTDIQEIKVCDYLRKKMEVIKRTKVEKDIVFEYTYHTLFPVLVLSTKVNSRKYYYYCNLTHLPFRTTLEWTHYSHPSIPFSNRDLNSYFKTYDFESGDSVDPFYDYLISDLPLFNQESSPILGAHSEIVIQKKNRSVI